MLTEGGPEQAVPLYNLGYKAYFKTPITFQESNAGHTLGQHCACLHDLDASNDELCAHCTRFSTIPMQCALPLLFRRIY